MPLTKAQPPAAHWTFSKKHYSYTLGSIKNGHFEKLLIVMCMCAKSRNVDLT